jgi:hypothetical protein
VLVHSECNRYKEITEQKRIPWLTEGEAYPFAAWSDDDGSREPNRNHSPHPESEHTPTR